MYVPGMGGKVSEALIYTCIGDSSSRRAHRRHSHCRFDCSLLLTINPLSRLTHYSSTSSNRPLSVSLTAAEAQPSPANSAAKQTWISLNTTAFHAPDTATIAPASSKVGSHVFDGTTATYLAQGSWGSQERDATTCYTNSSWDKRSQLCVYSTVRSCKREEPTSMLPNRSGTP